jgi:hypothetical protein
MSLEDFNCGCRPRVMTVKAESAIDKMASIVAELHRAFTPILAITVEMCENLSTLPKCLQRFSDRRPRLAGPRETSPCRFPLFPPTPQPKPPLSIVSPARCEHGRSLFVKGMTIAKCSSSWSIWMALNALSPFHPAPLVVEPALMGQAQFRWRRWSRQSPTASKRAQSGLTERESTQKASRLATGHGITIFLLACDADE